MSEVVLEAVGLERTYRGPAGPVHALRGVDLQVEAGEALAITGPSGCGKSTLLNVLGALDRPTGGRLTVCGRSLESLSPKGRALFRRECVGFVFQQFRLIPTLTATENAALPLRYAGVARRERLRRGEELLGRLGLGERLRHLPSVLSGGEQQRVAIARALVHRPPLLLADEPTGNLDGETAAEVLRALREAAPAEAALVIVTHDPELPAQLDRHVRLRDGELA